MNATKLSGKNASNEKTLNDYVDLGGIDTLVIDDEDAAADCDEDELVGDGGQDVDITTDEAIQTIVRAMIQDVEHGNAPALRVDAEDLIDHLEELGISDPRDEEDEELVTDGGMTVELDEDELDEDSETDHWGQAVDHYDEPENGAGEKRQCQDCGSRHEVALVGATASTSADNWEEFYQCDCGAEGTFRDGDNRTWTGDIDYPDKTPITDGGMTVEGDGEDAEDCGRDTRTLEDYVDLGAVFDEVINRPARCNCADQLDFYTCAPCALAGFGTPAVDEDTEGGQR